MHFFAQSSSSFRSTCPYQRSLFCCSTNATVSRASCVNRCLDVVLPMLQIFPPQGRKNDEQLCRSMRCYHPDFHYCYTTYEQRAFTGTSCGNKKVTSYKLKSANIWQSYKQSYKQGRGCLVHFLRLLAAWWPGAQSTRDNHHHHHHHYYYYTTLACNFVKYSPIYFFFDD